jgi:hypothetical protein
MPGKSGKNTAMYFEGRDRDGLVRGIGDRADKGLWDSDVV